MAGIGDDGRMSEAPQAPRMLVLVRHAQAKNRADGGDRDRELTKSGRRVAQAVGARLAREGVRADLAICSPAVRTVQTCEELGNGGLRIADMWGDPALYDADVEDVLDSIREVPDDVRTLLVVGHAPGVPLTAAQAADHTGLSERDLRNRLVEWPPAGVGVLVHDGSWATFPSGGSALVLLQEPDPEV